jgi:hypothetical protein
MLQASPTFWQFKSESTMMLVTQKSREQATLTTFWVSMKARMEFLMPRILL